MALASLLLQLLPTLMLLNVFVCQLVSQQLLAKQT
jgi:hypothetical protein